MTRIAVLGVLLLYTTAGVWAFSREPEYGADLPPFEVMTDEEAVQLYRVGELPQLVYQPVSFDSELETLRVRLFLRPDSFAGESVGDNWRLDATDVLLVFDGPMEVAGSSGTPYHLMEGDPDRIPPLLLEDLRAGKFRDPAWDRFLAAHDEALVGDVGQHAPFEVVLPAKLYGRSFAFRDDLFWFPFDSFGFHLGVQSTLRNYVDIDASRMSAVPGEWLPYPISMFPGRGDESSGGNAWRTTVDGWRVSYRHSTWLGGGFPASPGAINDGNDVGLVGVSFIVERPTSIILLAALFGLIYVVTMIALVIVVRSVRQGYRPPTGFGLVWAAALGFAAVTLRESLPAEIPYGAGFDWLFFFPTLLGASVVTLMLAVDWVRRDDYTP